MKEWAKSLFANISNHETCFYIAVVMFLIVFSFFVKNEMNHSSEVLKIQKEKAELIHHIQTLNEFSKEKNSFIDAQREMLFNQGSKLDEADTIIRQQSFTIEKLIQYLKSINQWPPKIQPEDPDKWTNAI